MSGIYISGIDFPTYKTIAVVIHPDGEAYSAEMHVGVCTKYLKDCKALAVPDHGDLIDRQRLLEDNKHLSYPTDCKYRRDRAWSVGFNAGAKHCNEHAYYAKTIIPADKEDTHEIGGHNE